MCKILVVDNDKKVREEVIAILVSLFPEHETITTGTTKKALDMVRNLRNVDIILFNSLRRNKPNGLEFAQECRKYNPYTMMIFMTENLHKRTKLKALCEIGLDSFISKPITKEVLELTFINVLARHKSLLNGKTPKHTLLDESVTAMVSRLNKKIDEKESSGFFRKIFVGRKKNERVTRTNG